MEYFVIVLLSSLVYLLVDNYVAIFRVDVANKTVYVVTVQYQGRNL